MCSLGFIAWFVGEQGSDECQASNAVIQELDQPHEQNMSSSSSSPKPNAPRRELSVCRSVWIELDLQLEVVDCNRRACRTLGYKKASELVGLSFSNLVTAQFGNTAHQLANRALEGTSTFCTTVPFLTKSGHTSIAVVDVAPTGTDDGERIDRVTIELSHLRTSSSVYAATTPQPLQNVTRQQAHDEARAPTLTKAGYLTFPSIDQIVAMSPAARRRVENFKIWRSRNMSLILFIQ